jgi:hypothetical protein
LVTPVSRRQIILGKFLAALSPWPFILAISTVYMALLTPSAQIFWLALLLASVLVHIQNRCRVRRYSENHETSDLRPFTFGHRKRALGNRPTLQIHSLRSKRVNVLGTVMTNAEGSKDGYYLDTGYTGGE